jgi:PAS domain S-box-containing protein
MSKSKRKKLKNEIAVGEPREALIRLLAQTVASVKDCVSITDMNDNILYVNESFISTYGYSEDELIGKNIKMVRSPNTDHKVAQQILPATLAGEWHGELINRKKNGVDFPIELWAAIVKGESGEPVAMVGIARDISKRKEAEETILHYVEFQKIVTTLSTKFINVEARRIDEAIADALRVLGEFVKVDRSYVFLFSDDGTKMDNTHEWCASDIEPQIENLQGLPVAMFPWWMAKLNRFENIIITRVADLPPEANAEKEILQSQDILSLAVIPMISKNILIGFLGFDSVRRERVWTDDEVSLLRIAGTTLANVIERVKSEEALIKKERQEALVLKSLPMVFYSTQLEPYEEILWISEQVEQITGFPLENFKLDKMFWANHIHPEDRDGAIEKFGAVLNKDYVYAEYRWQCSDGSYHWFADHLVPIRDESGKPKEVVGIRRDITDRKRLEDEREKLVSELKDALTNIKTLSGLIPICASCKKIRDDKGFWNQLEAYIVEHSDATFTHGICPECAEKFLREMGDLKIGI